MKQFGAVFGLVLRVFDYVISGEWCLLSMKQRTAQPQNRETSSNNSYRICGCETGHVRRVEKTRINGKGAEVYKNIYIKGTQRR